MKLFSDGRSANVEVYGRTLLARNSIGESQRLYPVLSQPPASDASGVLSAIPTGALFLDELTSTQGFKMLLINCDGANTNHKAVRMLMAELQPRKDLLVVVNYCSAHGLNNAVRWGLGLFSYGNILRACHVLQSVKHRNFAGHVKKLFRTAIEPDPVLLSETALDYVQAVWDEYEGVFKDPNSLAPVESPHIAGAVGLSKAKIGASDVMWKRFIKLITGQRGPFATGGKKRIPDFLELSLTILVMGVRGQRKA